MEKTIQSYMQSIDGRKGYMCVDKDKNCIAFSYDPIAMEGYETVCVNCALLPCRPARFPRFEAAA